jgi:curved DNA-binding protein CbpA
VATKKNLYQLLQVPRNATPMVIKAAWVARVKELGTSAEDEVVNQRNLLLQANEVLSDPVRRKNYDAKLAEEAARAAVSGGDALAPAPIPVMKQRAHEGGSSTGLFWMISIAVLVIGTVSGTWLWYDAKRNAQLQRQQREKLAEEERQRLDALLHDPKSVDYTKQPYNPNVHAPRDTRYETGRNYDQARWQAEQNRQARERAYEAQRATQAQRQADYQRQREEQENIRRNQQQLERDKRQLRELESQRPARY